MNKVNRALLHIPVGIFNVFAGFVAWPFSLVFAAGFLAYEVNEDWRLKDNAYIDIFGYLIGLVIGITALFIYQVVIE